MPSAEAPMLLIKISRKTSPRRSRFSIALKRNGIHVNRFFTKTCTQRTSNFRGRTRYSYKLRGITLVRGPIWRIQSLALIIPLNNQNNGRVSFLMLNLISHSVALLTREKSSLTPKKKFHIYALPCVVFYNCVRTYEGNTRRQTG